jgi:hypothetical protein
VGARVLIHPPHSLAATCERPGGGQQVIGSAWRLEPPRRKAARVGSAATSKLFLSKVLATAVSALRVAS